LHADVKDQESVHELAASTGVVITTVGPYALFGEPLVAACAHEGTNYVDLAGEPEFVDKMWLRYNEQAKATGARLVHCCGFDSIPHDLGAYFTVLQLPEGVPLTVEGQVLVGAQFSGGTFFSALTGFSRARQTIAAARAREKHETKPSGRRARLKLRPIHRDPGTKKWVAPLPTIDGFVIRRSAEAVDRYGPDFTYSHGMVAKHLITPIAMGAGIGLAFVAAQIRPLRNAMSRVVPPGEGPSEEMRAKSWFKVRFVGEGGGKKVVTEVSGGDPGYTETSKMLAESALALALDDIPDRAGQLSPIAAIGDALLERLPAAGIGLRVVS
jgi:short subunit dehydrogenase-like uncharacterized protein